MNGQRSADSTGCMNIMKQMTNQPINYKRNGGYGTWYGRLEPGMDNMVHGMRHFTMLMQSLTTSQTQSLKYELLYYAEITT